MLKVKHGGTNIILDATFIHIYYIQFDKRNVRAITILGVGKPSRSYHRGREMRGRTLDDHATR